MPSRLPQPAHLKAAVSVSEMARMCELSRSHFNLLIRTGVMPQPIYNLHNRRPLYDRDGQELCLRIRSTNIGADGQYVVFYDRRNVSAPAMAASSRARASRQQPTPQNDAHAELVEGLRALGLTDTTASQVNTALRACYPSGHVGVDDGEVIRELWRYLRRPNDGR